MHYQYFPYAAFLPAKGIKQRLTESFNLRAYRPADIRSIRTSVFYSNFKEVDGALLYTASIGHAWRRDDGMFLIYSDKTHIAQDPVRGGLSIRSDTDSDQQSPIIICPESQVMENLRVVEHRLTKESKYALAFPSDKTLHLINDIHINVAAMIFQRPLRAAYILDRQKALYHNHDQLILRRIPRP